MMTFTFDKLKKLVYFEKENEAYISFLRTTYLSLIENDLLLWDSLCVIKDKPKSHCYFSQTIQKREMEKIYESRTNNISTFGIEIHEIFFILFRGIVMENFLRNIFRG